MMNIRKDKFKMIKKKIIPAIIVILIIGLLLAIYLMPHNETAENQSVNFSYDGAEYTMTITDDNINIHSKSQNGKLTKDNIGDIAVSVRFSDGSEINNLLLSDCLVSGSEDEKEFDCNYLYGFENDDAVTVDSSDISYISFGGIKVKFN